MQEGDYVVPIFNGECGDCSLCTCQKTNMCEKFGVNPMKKVMVSDGTSRFSTVDGRPIFHFLNTSTFTEYTVVDSACVVRLGSDDHGGDGINAVLDTVSLKKLTLLSCGVSTGKCLLASAVCRSNTQKVYGLFLGKVPIWSIAIFF